MIDEPDPVAGRHHLRRCPRSPDRIAAPLEACRLRTLVVRLGFAMRRNTAGAHRIETALRDTEPVALIAVVRLLVGVLAVPRVRKHFCSRWRSHLGCGPWE